MSTQTETDAWIKTWISQVSQQLNSIETHMISDNQNLLSLLEDLCNLSEVEIESNQRKITDTNLLKSLQNLKSQLKEKRSELIYSQQMNYLVDELINENDELNIMKLLHAIPSKGPFTKRLKEALRKIQEKKNNDEVSAEFLDKVEKILKGSLGLIPSPLPSVKIQIMGVKVCLRCKGQTLLGVVNKLLKTKTC